MEHRMVSSSMASSLYRVVLPIAIDHLYLVNVYVPLSVDLSLLLSPSLPLSLSLVLAVSLLYPSREKLVFRAMQLRSKYRDGGKV